MQDYFAKWEQEGVVDIKHELEQILMLITGRCLLGKGFREKMTSEFFALFQEMENAVNLISFLFPYIPTPVNRRRDRARIKLSKFLSEIVRSHKMLNCVEDDMVKRLIDSMYKDGRSTTVAEVIGMIIGLIFAGKHTSSHSSSWTGACLLGHAKWLAAAMEEQKQLIGKYNDKIDYNVLLEMETLHSCIKEALRMHSPVPFFLLKVRKPYTVRTKQGSEYGIPRGDILVSPTILSSNIPYIYKDPEVYDPCRFLPGREEDKVCGKFSYTVFSAGRHACPGEAYAYMQIKIIWSHLLRNFELKLISPFPQADWAKFVPEPKGKLMVNYKRRRLHA
jgi:sterol 14alpha-demethylase